MRKKRLIGFAAAAIVAIGLTSGVASAAGAFSGVGAGSGGAKQTKPTGSISVTGGKEEAMPEGVAVQRTEDGLKVRKLTEEELENMDGAKPTKPLAEGSVPGEGKSDK